MFPLLEVYTVAHKIIALGFLAIADVESKKMYKSNSFFLQS